MGKSLGSLGFAGDEDEDEDEEEEEEEDLDAARSLLRILPTTTPTTTPTMMSAAMTMLAIYKTNHLLVTFEEKRERKKRRTIHFLRYDDLGACLGENEYWVFLRSAYAPADIPYPALTGVNCPSVDVGIGSRFSVDSAENEAWE